MVDLARWLGQQLDTDAAANESPYGEASWHAANCASLPDVFGQETSECDCGVPARVLREIDAKRGVVARYEFACREAHSPAIIEEEREVRVQVAGALQACVLVLARAYEDRPGYAGAVASVE